MTIGRVVLTLTLLNSGTNNALHQALHCTCAMALAGRTSPCCHLASESSPRAIFFADEARARGLLVHCAAMLAHAAAHPRGKQFRPGRLRSAMAGHGVGRVGRDGVVDSPQTVFVTRRPEMRHQSRGASCNLPIYLRNESEAEPSLLTLAALLTFRLVCFCGF